jgi:chaperonin cofactor prefoldin
VLSLLARHLDSTQTRLATLESQHRDIVGRLDTLEGKPNSTNGDPIERHIKWAEEAHG